MRIQWIAPSLLLLALPATAATLPAHDPLRVLVVSDEVNPHGLPDEQLTQPGELAAALSSPRAGLGLEAVLEVPTDQIELATAALELPRNHPGAYDVLVYFAHRIPATGGNEQARQDAFDAAVQEHLVRGGGVVSFHHGAYFTAGKEGIQDLLGATAMGGVTWLDQNVINTAPEHFVTCHEIDYPGTVAYADPARGVAAGTYPVFSNDPDERYPSFSVNASAGELVTLFGSDYVQNGATHLLGWTHRRPEWSGVVVGYQPGEHQPTALDPAGRNFQILANAILYAAGAVADDGIALSVARTVGEAVELSWEGCPSEVEVFRSDSPSQVVSPENSLGVDSDGTFADDPPPGTVVFYQVAITSSASPS